MTAINDKHASVIDEKTNKFDLFDKVLGGNLDNLEKISNNPKFTTSQRNHYKDKINYLKTMMFQNSKFIKRYQKNLRKIILKKLTESEYYGDEPKGFDDLIDKLSDIEKPNFIVDRIKTKVKTKTNTKTKLSNIKHIVTNSSVSSDDESDAESDDESDTEDYTINEITIKNKKYILDGSKVYLKNKNGNKGELYGSYSNGKVKKTSKKYINM